MRLIKRSLFCFLYASIAYGEPDQTINRACSQKKETTSALGKLIDKTMAEFSSQDARVMNAKQFISALDQIIAKSSFSYLLQCRENLKQTDGFSYKLIFQDPKLGNQSMGINPYYSRTNGKVLVDIELEFNLTKAANSVLFVYMHELQHLCQAVEAAKIATPHLGSKKSSADEIRFRLFGEVESFYTMQMAYRSLVQESTKLCGFEPNEHPPDVDAFYEIYAGSEKQLDKGMYAQFIVWDYLPEDGSEDFAALDMNSHKIEYTDPDSDELFTLRKLHPKLIALLNRLPISIIEN